MSESDLRGRGARPASSDDDPGTPFGRGLSLGRWWGVPVVVHWSALVTVGVLVVSLAVDQVPANLPASSRLTSWVVAAVVAPLFLVTLLAHEVAHAVTARRHGVPVRRISLWMLGGLTELDGEAGSPRVEALVAAAGPAASLTLGVGFSAVAWATRGADAVSVAAGWLAAVNVLLAVFNLLPGAPLDGGRLLRALLWAVGHDRARAARQSVAAGRGLGMILIVVGAVETVTVGFVGLWTLLVGWFILNAAASERDALPAGAWQGLRAADVMSPTPWVASQAWTVEEFLARLSPEAARQEIYPVVDGDGALTGVLTLAMLPARGSSPADRVGRVARTQVLTTAASSPLDEVAAPLRARGLAVVLDDAGRPLGVVTEADLTRAAAPDRAALRETTPPPHSP